jgi:tetratricopeptide (TPR) repeat protein
LHRHRKTTDPGWFSPTPIFFGSNMRSVSKHALSFCPSAKIFFGFVVVMNLALVLPANLGDLLHASANATEVVAPASEDHWMENVEKAILKAKKEKKDVLLFFTGSDWNPPCKKIEEEVFAEDDFYTESEEHFIYVKLDFPRNVPQLPMIAEQNKEWAERYGVTTYPTVILIDTKLLPYAIAGYEEGGFQNFLGMLEESRQIRILRDERLAEAAKATGDERARLLDEGISGMREEIVEVYYPEIVKEIVELDADDELGFRTKWNEAADLEMRKVILTDVMMIARLEKPEAAVEFIDEVLAEIKFSPKQRLEIMQIKLNVIRQTKDNAKIDQVLDDMIGMEEIPAETRERFLVKKILLMVGSNRKDLAVKLLNDSIEEGTKNGRANTYLLTAKGDLFDSEKKYAQAIEVYDQAISSGKANPDLLIELVSGKADALYASDDGKQALQILDNFADDTNMPNDLRAEALLHKAMLMRDSGRQRTARLAENRAVEIMENSKARGEIQQVVDRLRKKYGE